MRRDFGSVCPHHGWQLQGWHGFFFPRGSPCSGTGKELLSEPEKHSSPSRNCSLNPPIPGFSSWELNSLGVPLLSRVLSDFCHPFLQVFRRKSPPGDGESCKSGGDAAHAENSTLSAGLELSSVLNQAQKQRQGWACAQSQLGGTKGTLPEVQHEFKNCSARWSQTRRIQPLSERFEWS